MTTIRTAAVREKTLFRDGDTNDIIEAILYADQRSGQFINNEAARAQFQSGDEIDTLYNVWHWVRTTFRYRADKAGWERVQSPNAMMKSRVGDCKSFSVMEAALLRALGFKYKFRFAAYKNGDFSHVYVVAFTSRGREVILDAVHNQFDEQVDFHHAADQSPRRPVSTGINGHNAINGDAGLSAATLAGVLLLGFFLLKQLEKGQTTFGND